VLPADKAILADQSGLAVLAGGELILGFPALLEEATLPVLGGSIRSGLARD
jgi:hypothetical protein